MRRSTLVVTLAVSTLLAGCGSNTPSSSTTSAGGSSSSSSSESATSSGGSSAASFPATVTAANGQVTIPKQPQRIVSLSPTATEDLFAIGAGKAVVAVDALSNYPANAPKTTLSGLTPNIEAIAKYKPDLVVASQDSGGLVAGLKKLGVPVLIQPAAQKIDDAYTQINGLGTATGHPREAAKTVMTMRTQIASEVAKGGKHPGVSYFWEVSAAPYYSATSTTFIGQVVGQFGLTNVADKASKAADGGYPQLTPEYIIAAKPQLIFLADADAANGGQSVAKVMARPGWAAMPAVQNKNVIPVNADLASRWGPRLPQFVAAIAKAVSGVKGGASGSASSSAA
ncbi:ABC transporter substrate-binding protein [Calidifontibacter sp. DB0510]|uniref:ABC transporter substrate-binding protein n=1 Tax=Metallococcus carri TaxID=1656884 RepID=A0A967AWY4_9MICO|nr:ABC transporter substrate-binding protein [Metallococcus carri]NHN54233.1 ABC transporter substrate-binding protein [Metallococcus carri]NOP36927.1 ABC transporter substrate-binding protein [Calidifontibacter sp. DB2511S]